MSAAGLQRALAPLARRITAAIGRGVVGVVDDAAKWQAVQVELREGELRDNVEHAQPYGYTSHPHPGAEAVVVCVEGSRDHGIAVVVGDRRFRLRNLAQGEVALYTDQGDVIHIRRGGDLLIKQATRVRIEAPLVEMTGNLTVTGNVTVGGTVTASVDVVGGGISLKGHKHGNVAQGNKQTSVPI